MIRPPERCWLDPRVVARPSPIEGLGLFATGPIAKSEMVGILGGRVIDDDEVIARGNHSCDSNLWMRDEVTLEARRDIAAGEEVTIDYALQTSIANWEMACNCGSQRCRKVVHGDDWMRPELQDRYRGHFSPFLNRRIEDMDAEE
jgi:SET domain-containing protein